MYEINSYIRTVAGRKKDGAKRVKRIARALCEFLNYHYYKRIRSTTEKVVEYTIINEKMIVSYQNWLKSNSNLHEPSSRNMEIKYIYQLYWYLEYHRRLIKGVIGIADGEKNLSYSLPVRKPSEKQKTDFIIPILEKEMSKSTEPETSFADWEDAYLKASSKSGELAVRDALMIRIILDTGIRREELNTLSTNLFDKLPPIDVTKMFVTLNKSKFDETKGKRKAPFPVDLYRKIKKYIKTHRRQLKKTGVNDNQALFLSHRGCQLSLFSVNYILKQYGLKPHDGRKVSLTEMFIELIELGYSKDLAISEIAQVAGHSAKSKGQTLEDYYMIASRQLEAREKKQRDIMDSDENLKKIAELEAQIKELKMQVSESK